MASPIDSPVGTGQRSSTDNGTDRRATPRDCQEGRIKSNRLRCCARRGPSPARWGEGMLKTSRAWLRRSSHLSGCPDRHRSGDCHHDRLRLGTGLLTDRETSSSRGTKRARFDGLQMGTSSHSTSTATIGRSSELIECENRDQQVDATGCAGCPQRLPVSTSDRLIDLISTHRPVVTLRPAADVVRRSGIDLGDSGRSMTGALPPDQPFRKAGVSHVSTG
jgi:hypothetical protein